MTPTTSMSMWKESRLLLELAWRRRRRRRQFAGSNSDSASDFSPSSSELPHETNAAFSSLFRRGLLSSPLSSSCSLILPFLVFTAILTSAAATGTSTAGPSPEACQGQEPVRYVYVYDRNLFEELNMQVSGNTL